MTDDPSLLPVDELGAVVQEPSRSEEDALFDAVAPIAEALAHLRRRAEQLGIFIEERDLLACPSCGLIEDIASDGVLFTYFGEWGEDTGLRFAEQSDGTFRCPSCGMSVSPPPFDIDPK